MSKLELVNELHRSARKNFKRRSYIMRGVNETFQADLIEMIPHKSINKNFKYILTVIDVFSKYAWAIPLKNKTGIEVTSGMRSIFENDQRIPKNIHTDRGKEFYNVHFNSLMKKHNINLYSTYSKMKASIVERFNRTLLTKLWKQFSFQGTYKWIDILKSIIHTYNNTRHSTIKIRPVEVNKTNEKQILRTIYKQKINFYKNKFEINDLVRISKHKSLFEKGYTPSWSTEVFKICKVQSTNPVTYLLKDLNENMISGSFYEQELQKTKCGDIYLIEKIIRKKDNKLYVKWLGFDNSANSWINKNDFV